METTAPGRRARTRFAVLCVAAATLVVGAACGAASAQSSQARQGAPEPSSDWTMMVYGVGDTYNVSGLMVENLTLLTKLPELRDANVVVLVDLPTADVPGAPRTDLANIGRFQTAKMLLLREGEFSEIADVGEISMGRPDVLSWFISESARLFPAKKYGLTLFDHGGGWTGGYVDVGPPGTADLTLPEIREGMAAGMRTAGISRFDLLYHAACLMANYETASALAPLAKYQAGSEENMIQYPFSPAGLLPLAEDAGGDEVGSAFIQGYRQLLDDIAQQPGGEPYRDLLAMSVVDSDKIMALDKAVEAFADAAVPKMAQIAPEVARARAAALEFVVGLPGADASSGIDHIDLGDFLRQMQNLPDDVAVARNAVFEALRQSVTDQVTGRGTEQAMGLNVFLPTNPSRVGNYFRGSAPDGWGRFLEAFLTAGNDASGEPGQGAQFVNGQATVDLIDQSGVRISGQLRPGSAANVVSSEAQVYAPLGGQERALAMVLPAYVGAGGAEQVQGVWSYAVAGITDGSTVAPATAGFQAQGAGLVGSLTARYTNPQGDSHDIGFRVLLGSDGTIEGVTIVDVTGGTSSGVQLERGGTVTPYLYVAEGGEFRQVLSDQTIEVGDALQVTFTRMATGTPFRMVLLVADVGRNLSSAAVEERVR